MHSEIFSFEHFLAPKINRFFPLIEFVLRLVKRVHRQPLAVSRSAMTLRAMAFSLLTI
jgi:hypothetical protein